MGLFDKVGSILGSVGSVLDDIEKFKNVFDPPKAPKSPSSSGPNNTQGPQGPGTFGPPFLGNNSGFGQPGSVFNFPGLPPVVFPDAEPEPSFLDENMNLLLTGVAAGVLVFLITRGG